MRQVCQKLLSEGSALEVGLWEINPEGGAVALDDSPYHDEGVMNAKGISRSYCEVPPTTLSGAPSGASFRLGDYTTKWTSKHFPARSPRAVSAHDERP